MNIIKNTVSLLSIIALVFALNACGGKKKEASIPAEAEKLIGKTWTKNLNASIKESTDATEEGTGIKADIELKGDVGKIANAFGEVKYVFDRDKKDKSKLSYSKTTGKGLLKSTVLGYWDMAADGKTITLREWDKKAGKEKAPVSMSIKELTDTRLVIQQEGKTPSVFESK